MEYFHYRDSAGQQELFAEDVALSRIADIPRTNERVEALLVRALEIAKGLPEETAEDLRIRLSPSGRAQP